MANNIGFKANMEENNKKEQPTWSIAGLWNEALKTERWPSKKRNYISASDLGKPFLERWYKMQGIPETNPFEERVLRVFAAGNEFHHLITTVFEKIGILIDSEQRVEIPATSKTLKVLGYYDNKVGGITDWNQARKRIKDYGFSPAVETRTLALVDYFENNLPEGIKNLLYEVKSVNSMAFWAHQRGKGYLKEAYPHHELQLYTYLKALDMPEGRILYVSKDDLCLDEKPVFNPTERLEQAWKKDVETMSEYIFTNTEPLQEPSIVFDKDKKKYVLNWKIERSVFLTKMTGLSKEDWQKKTKEEVKEMNKQLKKKK